jgi:hypothetical protein
MRLTTRARPDSTAKFCGYQRLRDSGLWVEVARSPSPSVCLAKLMRRVPRGDIAVRPAGSGPTPGDRLLLPRSGPPATAAPETTRRAPRAIKH